jgi:two-component system NtrC family sensor kinase
MFEYQKLNQQVWDSFTITNNAKNLETETHDKILKFLEDILEGIQHKAGLVYAPINNLHHDNHWATSNLSPQFQHQIDTQEGEIPQLLKQIIINNEIPDVFPDGIALISPIKYASELLGLFVIEGDSITDAELNTIYIKSESLSEKLYLTKLRSDLEEYKQEITALKSITRTQTAGNDINSIQIEIINSIRSIFNAEEVFLIEFNKDNSNLGIKKHLGLQNNWLSQEGIIMEEGLIWQSVFSKRIIEILDVQTNTLYNPNFDGVQGILVQTLVIIPLQSDGRIAGTLVLINTPSIPLIEERKDLLHAMTSALNNAMENINLFQQLKISNESLETSRWELLNSRNTLRALFDSIPASMYIIDQKFILQAINMSRANRINQPPNKLVGGNCYEKLYGLSEPCPGCRILETYITGRTTSRIHRQWMDDESFLEWEITTYPIQNEDNVPIQAILIEQDVTDKRNLETNLIQSEKLAAVGQLAAGVAHEINNPLAAIIANAQLLLREIPEDDQNIRDSLHLIEVAGSRASQVVKNLLGFARKEQYNFEHIHINETINNALSLVQHEINSRSILIKLDLSNNMPMATASKDHLQGVWINLIMNAIDSFENVPGEILISTKFVEDKFLISVSDNGKGISPEKLNRIFEPFFTTKSVGRGTGLGLSVCHRIIKKHGGLISVESIPNKGTKFTVTLPASPKFKITSN